MALSVDYIYNFGNTLINKNQAMTYSPDNFFYIWNSEQRAFYGDLIGRFQNRGNGKTGANTGLPENERVLTMLRPFTKPVNISLTSGVGSYPSDFIYLLALRSNGHRVWYLNKGQWYSATENIIDPPSISNNMYYFTDYANGFSVLPTSISSVDMDYLGDVQDVVWAFTLDVNGEPVYNSGSSVQPLWGNLELIEITKRTLKSIGVRFSSQDFENFGQTTITTGN